MMCTCPKCHAKIELDLPEVSVAGIPAACTACNARFTVHRESFGGRALRKASEISCALCGSELGHETHCAACGAQFPDYLVASLGRKRIRRNDKKLKLKNSPFPHPQRAINQLPSLEMSMRPDAATSAAVLQQPGAKYPKPVAIAVSLLVLAALIGGGSFFYLKNEAEKAYAKNFVMATYCVQSGVERCAKSNARITAEWKAKTEAGQSYAARASGDDERALGIINRKIESVSPKLSQPPKKFAVCSDKLAKIQAVYAKVQRTSLAPGNSLQNFSDTNGKLEAEYKQAIKDYKSGMPAEIMEEIESASLRFKGLKTLLH